MKILVVHEVVGFVSALRKFFILKTRNMFSNAFVRNRETPCTSINTRFRQIASIVVQMKNGNNNNNNNNNNRNT